MCGVAGIVSIDGRPIVELERKLDVMNRLVAHRGPDGEGTAVMTGGMAGLAHRRLSIIDLSETGSQPMHSENGTAIVHNGEIYNYIELRRQLGTHWQYRGHSDTETILAAYEKYDTELLERLRGMFAFALWDDRKRRLFCARDRFGIKPFYFAIIDGILYFSSEAKALLPFLLEIETEPSALAEYLTFQYTIGEHTLFKGIRQLLPAHALVVEGGHVRTWRYWDVRYDIDFDHSPAYFGRRLSELLDESLRLHLRSDVPVGSYLSGGVDSSLVSVLSAQHNPANRLSFHGKFTKFPGYDESDYARLAAEAAGSTLYEIDITADHFRNHIRDIIYHLDFPIAGPGSFPQFVVSQLASEHVKVVLGGQGGDEVFGGYARYLIAYFEQCIKAALDGTYRDGNFVVTIESIVPNLGLLREYKPLITKFWGDGLFGPLDERYLRLIDRSSDIVDEVDWAALDRARVLEAFRSIFNNRENTRKEAYFDSMTHFDFKCLLPALLHVEDRMSMAHGLESRVPFLDHPLVEFAATLPADVKFEGGKTKQILKTTFASVLPAPLRERRDKMGFPVPLKEWFEGELHHMIVDVFRSTRARNRPYVNSKAILANFDKASRFSRKIWGLLSLELWHQSFHDKAADYRSMIDREISSRRTER